LPRTVLFRTIAPMEFTQDTMDALAIDEALIVQKVAAEIGIRETQVRAVIDLVNEGCTVPFIARYRKEKHGSLDET